MDRENKNSLNSDAFVNALGVGSYTVVLSLGAAFNFVASPGAAFAIGLGGGLALAVPMTIGAYKAAKWTLTHDFRSQDSSSAQPSGPSDQEQPNP